MKIALIKRLDDDSRELFYTKKKTIPLAEVIDHWQANKERVIGRRPPIKYKWAEASNLVDALIELRTF